MGSIRNSSRQVRTTAEKLCAFTWLTQTVRAARSRGESVVFTNGCFELLHLGHVRCLEAAAREGDYLVVAVNSDWSFRRLRGRRPLLPWHDRAEVLAALACVDLVVKQQADTPTKLVEVVGPDVLVKGGDWRLDEIAGRDLAGRVVVVPELPGRHVSDILRRAGEVSG